MRPSVLLFRRNARTKKIRLILAVERAFVGSAGVGLSDMAPRHLATSNSDLQSLITVEGPVIIAVMKFCHQVLHIGYHCCIVFESVSMAESIPEFLVPEKNNKNVRFSSSLLRFSAMIWWWW